MSTYYILNHTYTKSDYYIEESSETIDICDLNTAFKPLEIESIAYSFKGSRATDYVSGVQYMPIISERLKQLLQEHTHANMEFIQANLRGRAKIHEPYYVMNLMEHTQCINKEKSKLSETECGKIFAIKKLVVDKERIAERSLFRLNEMRSLAIVKEDLKEILMANKITGIQFKPMEEFVFPPCFRD